MALGRWFQLPKLGDLFQGDVLVLVDFGLIDRGDTLKIPQVYNVNGQPDPSIFPVSTDITAPTTA